MFLSFMLARLISARQVVLLYGISRIHLFYQGQVYSRSVASGFENLPECLGTEYYPIWLLINVDTQVQGPRIPEGSFVWPVQASPPDPVRWKGWQKQLGAAVFGMPPWDMEELMEGYVFGFVSPSYHRPRPCRLIEVRRLLTFIVRCSLRLWSKYDRFRSRLGECLPLLGGSTLPITGDESIDAALKVLQREAEKEKGHSIKTSSTDQDENTGEADQPQAPVDNTLKIDDALKILVHNATQEFGFAPRDVCDGVFDLRETRWYHATQVEWLHCSGLKTLVDKFSHEGEPSDSSEPVVVIHPRECASKHDRWEIDFKSVRIARRVVESMRRLEEGSHLWETYKFLRKAPGTSAFAGRVFEVIVHRILSYGWRSDAGPAPRAICLPSDNYVPPGFSTLSKSSPGPLGADAGPIPQPIRTVSNNRERRTFSTGPSSLSSSTPDTSLSPSVPRAVIPVNFTELSNVTLDKDKYYIPSPLTHPLADPFTIDLDLNRHTAVISVFQIETSPRHEGSAEGYHLIGKIVARVRKLLKNAELNASVEVAYFLVCPEDEDGSQHLWQMSVHWNKNASAYGYCGNAFCIRIPVSGRHGTSRVFTLDSATWLDHGWI